MTKFMKRDKIRIVLTVLLLSLLMSCASKPKYEPLGLFSLDEYYWHGKTRPDWLSNWDHKNEAGEYFYYCYTITNAPKKYVDFIGTTVFYPNDGNGVGNIWYKDCEKELLIALDHEDFYTIDMGDRLYICTDLNLNHVSYKPSKKYTFEDDKDAIYHILKLYYAGFPDMKKKGFTNDEWEAVNSYDDITNILDKYMNDTHFSINTKNDYYYHQSQRFDEGTSPSIDPAKTCIFNKTSNTFYIRYNSCDTSWDEYLKLPSLAKTAKEKDFIVLDFRSNHGGGNGQQFEFFRNLVNYGYKGTIFVLQDNWSYSSGEVWETTGDFINTLNFKLAGTHSGGAQMYGNCRSVTKKGVIIWVPTTSFASILPENYLGEGLGYEPDIWATTPEMKSVLEAQGLDLTGIIFQ